MRGDENLWSNRASGSGFHSSKGKTLKTSSQGVDPIIYHNGIDYLMFSRIYVKLIISACVFIIIIKGIMAN